MGDRFVTVGTTVGHHEPRGFVCTAIVLEVEQPDVLRIREGARYPSTSHPDAAGVVVARRRGEVAGPLESGRRRLIRTWRPRGHRPAAFRTRRVLRRSGQRAVAGARS